VFIGWKISGIYIRDFFIWIIEKVFIHLCRSYLLHVVDDLPIKSYLRLRPLNREIKIIYLQTTLILNIMPFTEGLCEKVQEALNNVVSDKPSIKRTQLGYLQALTSNQNTAGVTAVPIDPGNGKKKSVRLTYIKRAGDESEVKETEITDCSTEVEREPFEEIVDIESYQRSPGLKFDENQMRKLCAPDSTYMQEVVSAELDLFMRVLNKKLIATQAANFGTFNGGATFKSVVLLKGSDSKPNYFGESEILEAFEDLDVAGRPIVIGAGNLGHYVRQVGIGCCNEAGINFAQAGAMDFYRDRFVEGILGANAFIGLVPGMVQLMTWNKYVGTYAKENQVFSHGTIIDPVTGIKLDQKWHYNDCNDTWALHFGLNYDLHFLPDNAFTAADELFGYNGTLKFVGVGMDEYGCCA
jgi:hypothetical protein